MSNTPHRTRPSFSQRVAAEIRGGRNMFSAIFTSGWNSLGSWLGTYDATDPRNQAMRGVVARPVSAADLVTSQPYIRNLCRNYERNNATVRAATEGLVANIVGHGIDLEPDTGNPEHDKLIGKEWDDYQRDCFVDRMEFFEGQRLACREVVVAGEALWRYVIDPERAKDGRIPLCIMPLESEWLGDSGMTVVGMMEGYVGGIKLDTFGRPITYSLKSPSGQVEEVPVAAVSHIFERRRALQIRGEPWFASVITTLHQEKDLVTSELEAAKNTANFAVAITSNGTIVADLDEKGSPVRDISLGSVVNLQQGEDAKILNHTRPSQQIAPFRSMLRGDLCGALRIGRSWIDRDPSNANYSSRQADQQDGERLLSPVREWFGHQSAGRLYKKVLPYLAIRAGILCPRDNYRLVPDGQPYVDPLKDVQAAALAIAYGLSTFEAEVGKRGGDYKRVWEKLKLEKDELGQAGLVLQSPANVPFGDPADIKEQQEMMGAGASEAKEGVKKPATAKNGEVRSEEDMKRSDLIELLTLATRQQPSPAPIHNTFNLPPPVTNLTQTVEGATVNVRQEAQQPPIVNLAVAPSTATVAVTNEIRQEAQPQPVVNVNVQSAVADVVVQPSTANVEIENNVTVPQRTVRAVPQSDGSTLIKPVDK